MYTGIFQKEKISIKRNFQIVLKSNKKEFYPRNFPKRKVSKFLVKSFRPLKKHPNKCDNLVIT